MAGFARLLLIMFVVLTIVYVALSFYSRSVRRGKLEADWYLSDQTIDKETFVRQGLEDYDRSLRRKLILGVYVLPMGAMAAIIYFTNFF